MASNTTSNTTVPQAAAAEVPRAAQSRQTWWASLVILCAILGALIGLSVKARDMIHSKYLPADNYAGLSVHYEILEQKNKDDVRQITYLSQQVSDLEKGTSDRSIKVKTLLAGLQQAKLDAGETPVAGPGLIVTLNDSKKPYPAAMQIPGTAPANLIHDTDINQVVNELKAAGAEAITVNGQRLTAMSSIRCAGPTVYVSGTPATPPYVIEAIGDPQTLETAINLPGGVGDMIRQFDPAMITLKQSKHLVVPASPGPPPPHYAKPVADSAGTPE